MRAASPIISEAQSRTFGATSVASVDGCDFAYTGFSLEDYALTQDEFVLTGTSAIKNKVLLWLSSSYGDYVREPNKGGPLENLLGKTLTEDNAAFIKISLQLLFKEIFAGDLTLAEISVNPNKDYRRWDITLLVQDIIRRELFELAIGADY